MFRGIRARISAFRSDTRGVVLYLVALLMVPFLVLVGVAVDVGQLLFVKTQLAGAIDSAALDISATPGLTQDQANARAQAFVSASLSSGSAFAVPLPTGSGSCTPPSSPPSCSANTVCISPVALPPPAGSAPANTVCINASASVNTAFVRILGSQYNTLSATVSTQVTAAPKYLEVVLVLDNTGSMGSMYGSMTGIQGLQLAATTLVNTLFAGDPTQQFVKIGVVPFTENVNAGIQYANAAWIDNANAANSMSQENIDVPTGTGLITFATLFATAANKPALAWSGCVRQRNEPYDIEDVSPDSGSQNTLFTPFFAPAEPNGNLNHYLNNGSCGGNASAIQRCIAKYTSSPQIIGNIGFSSGPNANCTIQQIKRLSNDQTGIINEIDAMQANGNTVIPAGLMWGWHLLSPNGPFADGVPYTDTKTIKVIILVTDGYNDVNGANGNGLNLSRYSAYGYGSGQHLNVLQVPPGVNRPQPEYNLDVKLTALCSNIKAVQDANGNPGRILLYAIGFGSAIDNYGLGLLQQCASNASTYFYNPTSDELVTTFQKIAVGLSKLRISK